MTHPDISPKHDTLVPVRGYLEGYYGRLLSWQERHQLLRCLHDLGLSHYFYAPKEDIKHRLRWRCEYGDSWRREYVRFCTQANKLGVQVITGVAPGLDFNFAHLDGGNDFKLLMVKAQQLMEDGASGLALLMDDIDADFHCRAGGFSNEGEAHAALANLLASNLNSNLTNKLVNNLSDSLTAPISSQWGVNEPDAGNASASNSESERRKESDSSHESDSKRPVQLNDSIKGSALWVVPRVYADEIATESPDYLPAFLHTLAAHHAVVYCGSHIVAEHVSSNSLSENFSSQHEVIVWDNLYANDYCPRRLFLGPYRGRDPLASVLLNPTGMVQTDCLLLELMQTTLLNDDAADSWQQVMACDNLPSEFQLLAPYMNLPAFGGMPDAAPSPPTKAHFAALEVLLWKWKSPLSREWYPFLMGLKQDLLLASGELPVQRVHKTQTPPLAGVIATRL